MGLHFMRRIAAKRTSFYAGITLLNHRCLWINLGTVIAYDAQERLYAAQMPH